MVEKHKGLALLASFMAASNVSFEHGEDEVFDNYVNLIEERGIEPRYAGILASSEMALHDGVAIAYNEWIRLLARGEDPLQAAFMAGSKVSDRVGLENVLERKNHLLAKLKKYHKK